MHKKLNVYFSAYAMKHQKHNRYVSLWQPENPCFVIIILLAVFLCVPLVVQFRQEVKNSRKTILWKKNTSNQFQTKEKILTN